jgi:dihydroflavonol-4-reductase
VRPLPLAFVTGGTGFLGLNLVEQLALRGWEIVALHRAGSDTSRLSRFPVRLAVGDVSDSGALGAALPDGADAVFHCAANTATWSRRFEQQWRDNVGGTAALVAAARLRGARRFVHVSTGSVYGHGHGVMTEDSPQLPRGGRGYAASKLAAEQAVKAAVREGLGAVVINPGHIIGRYDTHNWARMIEMTAKGTLPGVPPGSGSFCHAAAVAEAMIAAAERGKPGQNYLLGGADASFVEVFRIIGALTGKKVPKRPMPAVALRLYARLLTGIAMITGREPQVTPDAAAIVTGHARIDSSRAIRELGYQPVALDTMLEDAYRWMKGEGLLGA